MEEMHRTHREPAWGWIGALLQARRPRPAPLTQAPLTQASMTQAPTKTPTKARRPPRGWRPA